MLMNIVVSTNMTVKLTVTTAYELVLKMSNSSKTNLEEKIFEVVGSMTNNIEKYGGKKSCQRDCS